MILHVVLYQLEILHNPGNIELPFLATNPLLYLFHQLGFSIIEKQLNLVDLDYWENVDVHEYDHIDALYEKYPKGLFYYLENYGTKYYTEADFNHQEADVFLIFGKETKGFPRELLSGKEDQCFKIHMSGHVRSLNLANTVAITLYEALRQQNFPNLD